MSDENASDPTVKQLRKVYYENIINERITEKKRCYVSSYGMEDWMDNLINQEFIINEEYNLSTYLITGKRKFFRKKDWSMRQTIKELPIKMETELLDKPLKDSSFNQVR